MKLPFTINDLRFTIREESAGGTGVAPVKSGVAPDLGRECKTGTHEVQSNFAFRAGFGRDARNNRRDACSTRLVFNRQSSIVNRKSQSGVALVLTLILLSVALVMTLAFLAISGREQGSVTTQTDTATTRLAADAGLAAAEAQIAANILSTTNPYSFGLIVSTNYINTVGFQSGVANFTNVNYYDSARNFLAGNNFLQNLENLSYSPRPPVFILQNGTNDFRYYLDLNRNGVDEPNGWVADMDNAGNTNGVFSFQVGDPEWIGVLERPDLPYGPNNPFIARYAFIVLPVGNSLDLNAIHNQAFDTITGNRAVNPPPIGLGDVYFRNQGVGSWELNLAAFLADLNTNEWDNNSSGNGYKYNQANSFPPGPSANSGAAFDDARALLAFRYANNYLSLMPVGGNSPPGLFTTAGIFPPFQNNIDAYSDLPLMTTTAGINAGIQNVTLPWAGADNTNHFFDLPSDLFDPTRTQTGVTVGQIGAGDYFGNHLATAGNGASTYDRYTLYRMLAQLGTDTTPESGKMNLNYDNLNPGFSGADSATNFMAWTPLGFFNNAADRLLKAYTAQWAVSYILVTPAPNVTNLVAVPNPSFVATFNVTAPFGVTGIPVLVSNRFVYTPAVNRLLQLAANLYDATTTNHYPDIFRPVFSRDQNGLGTNIFIIGYTTLNTLNPNGSLLINRNTQMTVAGNNGVLDPPIEVTALPPGTNILANVYGVPWIIGAKKGFPNFNAISVESAFQLVRKLEVMRDTNAVPQPHITWTNQMYLMNITNYMGVSFWNSYRSNYAGPVDIVLRCGSSMMLENTNNYLNPPYTFTTNFAFASEISTWPAWSGAPAQASPSFVIPLNTGFLMLTNAMYYYGGESLLNYLGDSPGNYLDKGIRELPQFWLMTTNRLQAAIIDYSAGYNNGRIVDYVQLGGMDSSQDLNAALLDPKNNPYHFWNTNYDSGGNLYGIIEQIQVSETGENYERQALSGSAGWTTGQIPGGPIGDTSPAAQQQFFRGFFNANGIYSYGGQFYVNSQSAMQAPYTPAVNVVQHTTWEVNDPLVHYLASDLAPHTATPIQPDWGSVSFYTPPTRYQPWGLPPPSYVSGVDPNPANLAFKDPLVRESDSWDFPAGKLPTAGWLGRVHRGTPWQTVYLKATNILAWANNVGQNGFNTWKTWTGDFNLFDAANAAPVDDYLLFDLFTTAFNDNATRGQLSVNVSSNSLAAWSAVFSGIVTLSNNFPNSVIGLPNRYQNPLLVQSEYPPAYTNLIISPAGGSGMNSALGQIVAGIDRTRATFMNADGLVGVFEHKGDILAVPQLTEQSPFLNTSAAQQGNGISDEMYEWLPQQVMSLVRDSSSPRYVIYSYGQALKPSPNGIYQGSATLNGQPAFGMVTNYQVMSEMATRAVVRLDTVRTNSFSTDGAIIVTPPRAVIESFNILPPD